MHDHFAGLRIVPADRDVLGRQRDDLAGDADLAVIVGHDLDLVAGLAAVGIVGVGLFRGLRAAFAAIASASAVVISVRLPWPSARTRPAQARA